MMKKMLGVLLILLLAFSASAFGEEEFTDGEAEAYTYTGPVYELDHLVVGNTTALSGNFTSRMWGYNTSDLDVSALVNGYNLVRWNYEKGNFETDTGVVTRFTATVNEGDGETGSCTYDIQLNQTLVYSDGTPVTAADYAFAILLNSSAQAAALGGDTDGYDAIQGVVDYRSGQSRSVAGIRIPDAYTLQLTVVSEYRPFFYELGLLRCNPMPIHVIAPECAVKDDGEGAYIDGPFTSELLQQTMLDPDTGYLSHPSVVSGPYRLVSFDAQTCVAEFEINENYQGNSEGVKPTIRRLTLKPASNSSMIGELADGSYGLLDKCLDKDAIQEGLALIGEGNYAMSAYPRTGMSFLSFNCEKALSSRQAVRQAIACCLDKDEIVSRYTGNYGLRVDGYYGIGQWMYRVVSGYMTPPVEAPAENASEAEMKQYEEELEKWGTLTLANMKIYPCDPEEAVRLLEEDGWTLNRQGEAFVPGTDDVRCRMENGQLETLELTLCYPEGNRIGAILEEVFLPVLKQAGIGMTLQPLNWQQLLRQYYRQDSRDCDMFYLASNFYEVFNPWPTFDPADAETGKNNYTGIRDEELYRTAGELIHTEPGDNYGYLVRWIAFQERFAEVLPAIPVYSNVYYDFYTRYLQNFTVQQNMTWAEAVVSAFMQEPAAEEPAALPEDEFTE